MIDHGEFLRNTDNCEIAVLMIHGIAGSPAHFRKIIDVIPQNLTLYNILLDGHGKGVSDFGKSSMKKWKTQVNDTANELLESHDRLFIIAHSMGTLFAIRKAIETPDKIAGLFLLSVPTRPWVRFSTVKTCIRVLLGKKGDDVTRITNDTSINLDKNPFKYLSWAPRFAELLIEVRRVRKLLPILCVNSLTFQSHIDELVSARSVKDLEEHPFIKNTVLYESGHFDYGERDVLLLRKQLSDMINSFK